MRLARFPALPSDGDLSRLDGLQSPRGRLDWNFELEQAARQSPGFVGWISPAEFVYAAGTRFFALQPSNGQVRELPPRDLPPRVRARAGLTRDFRFRFVPTWDEMGSMAVWRLDLFGKGGSTLLLSSEAWSAGPRDAEGFGRAPLDVPGRPRLGQGWVLPSPSGRRFALVENGRPVAVYALRPRRRPGARTARSSEP
jgi:hypothetical protein